MGIAPPDDRVRDHEPRPRVVINPGLWQSVELFQRESKADPEAKVVAPRRDQREFSDLFFLHHAVSFFRFMIRGGLVRQRELQLHCSCGV
jgi:hypothetical protein